MRSVLVHAPEARALLDCKAISKHLKSYNYPKKALNHFINCGKPNGLFLIKSCSCGTRPIQLTTVCNNKFCPLCSKKRTGRLKRRMLPYLASYRNNWSYTWKFLTLSPKSYSSYEGGKKAIREGWKRFLRVGYSFNKDGTVKDYVKDVIKGGFMVVEVTKKDTDLWHFHIHAIIYSRHLDNRLRRLCPHCSQNYVKFDRSSKKYYCANRSCNHLHQGFISDSKLTKISKSSFDRPVMCDISQAGSPIKVLNYLLKYVSVHKESFTSDDDFYFHIGHSYKDRLITSFGEFYNYKKSISPDSLMVYIFRCSCCGEVPKYTFDAEISMLLCDSYHNPPPPPIKLWF